MSHECHGMSHAEQESCVFRDVVVFQDRERLKEQKKEEKRIERELKIVSCINNFTNLVAIHAPWFRSQEQKHLETEMQVLMKTSMEDMSVPDLQPLPQFDRLPGVLLDGEAYANCLMTVEFCHNFKEALNFGEFSHCFGLKEIP